MMGKLKKCESKNFQWIQISGQIVRSNYSLSVSSSTHSQVRHQMEVTGQFHTLAIVPWGKATLCLQSGIPFHAHIMHVFYSR